MMGGILLAMVDDGFIDEEALLVSMFTLFSWQTLNTSYKTS